MASSSSATTEQATAPPPVQQPVVTTITTLTGSLLLLPSPAQQAVFRRVVRGLVLHLVLFALCYLIFVAVVEPIQRRYVEHHPVNIFMRWL